MTELVNSPSEDPNPNIFLSFATQMTLYYCSFIPGISQNQVRLVLVELKLVIQL